MGALSELFLWFKHCFFLITLATVVLVEVVSSLAFPLLIVGHSTGLWPYSSMLTLSSSDISHFIGVINWLWLYPLPDCNSYECRKWSVFLTHVRHSALHIKYVHNCMLLECLIHMTRVYLSLKVTTWSLHRWLLILNLKLLTFYVSFPY